MSGYERPHYMYISRVAGEYVFTIMTKKQETIEQPLTTDLAFKWANEFLHAAKELHRLDLLKLTAKEKQEDMFDQAVQGSAGGSSDHPDAGGLPPSPTV